ncbi:MAG: hypothetical protein HY736_09530, partial [Verrucomicrobia bacterium]|nr:hypothetical protein [Verrucomicrobiota bacterium]
SNYAATLDDHQCSGELLILPDGRILAHNITPALARVLATLDPANEAMRQRAGDGAGPPAIAGQAFRHDVAEAEINVRHFRGDTFADPPLPPLSHP